MLNVFLLGLDAFNARELASIRGADGMRFHRLLTHEKVVRPRGVADFDALLERAAAELDAFPGRVDAVASYWDFPSNAIAGVLRNARGLPGPTDAAICKCEHKIWSRIEQRAAVPAMVPGFAAFDPFAADPLAQIGLDFPFWVKPVKAHSSHLGFRIRDRAAFERHLPEIRAGIGRFGGPFDQYLARLDLPDTVRGIGGHWCIAEEIISAGRQCTLEGYVHAGETVIYGFVDSVRAGRHRSSFARYQYPSALPGRVRARMAQAAAAVMARFGYDGAPFNMEFFWDPARDRIRLLEVNARISKSHCPLFRMVDGHSHQEVMVDLALGRRPCFPSREGAFRMAAKFMLRVFEDGRIARVPGAEDIARVERLFPEARVHPLVAEGTVLRHLPCQDSYSFELAELFLGGDSRAELLRKHERCLALLPFALEPAKAA